ncbi:hypothetical protein L195_g031419 [Trifolium pratense]|uniref:Reverse transcriptase zinc-binding domain-containing protein n=1 Tax=Trifolium pratense TaxID=57577 RepID=A0A2K3LAB8_TRIPR|nr:hypothetical protein L195_g031419 [Trifolium pratense]
MEPVIYLRNGILSRKDTARKLDQKTVYKVDDEFGTDIFAVSAGGACDDCESDLERNWLSSKNVWFHPNSWFCSKHLYGVDVSSQHSDWKSLWKIHAPPKAKHLLWRICKGCLSTRIQLQESNEDDWHILFDCIDNIHARQAAGLDHVIMLGYSSSAVFLSVWNDSKEQGRSLRIKARLLWEEWNSVHQMQCDNQPA